MDEGATGIDRWVQGTPRADLAQLLDHWRNRYNWRAFEGRVNASGPIITSIDGLDIHALHVCSSRPDATPLLLTHGWPGSIGEFTDVLPELANPADENEPAFHVVVPSLPGFGFSGKPRATGWGVERIARAWVVLMERLGYDRFLAHGGDWGGIITTVLGGRFRQHVIGVHTTVAQPPLGLSLTGLTPREREWVERSRAFWGQRAAYAKVQASSPQTLGYGLADSPAGQLAWILEKFSLWTDSDGSPVDVVGADRILDTATLYWLTNSGASSARIYTESHASLDPGLRVDVPAAVCTYPHDIERWPRAWAEQRFRRIVHWQEASSGGHFASLERPEFFLHDLRQGLAAVLSQ